MDKDAFISECGEYRYWLRRVWDSKKKLALFVMLNPSTADASVDDPTIRKCMGFCERLGFGGFVVINLSAFRARDPAQLFNFLRYHPTMAFEEHENLSRSLQQASVSEMTVICAWGRKGRKLPGRTKRVLDYLRYLGLKPKALRITDGTPHHPLMLPYTCTLKDFK